MTTWRERWNQLRGKNRYVVSRIFIHLAGQEAAPLLGILNRTGREAMESEGDFTVLGEGLVELCQNLLQLSLSWQSVGNEGEIFTEEGDAADFVNELFTDSAQRYLAQVDYEQTLPEDESLFLPVTSNLVVIIVVAYVGECPELETNLADGGALKDGLKSLINLFFQERLQAIQVHFSPAKLGDELTEDQLLLNFPELIPL